MVDVMLIMLIFFMVTSSYLDLDMIPVVGGERQGETAAGDGEAPPPQPDPAARTERLGLLVRLDADGRVLVSGQIVDFPALAATVAAHRATRPSVPVLLLPSGEASTQALVTLMDALATAGADDVRIVRFDSP
ncbi:MAG: biopolymer transporter ExbD [Inquilinus sp.]|nr:biopolymer transporter ExbD [Inquilinus sp.]